MADVDDTVADGHPCWIDLSTPDVATAERFYRELLGWDVAVNSTPMGDYHVGSIAGRDVAGMMTQPAEMAGAPAMWTVFFYVEDLDAFLTAVTDAGGAVLQQPFEIPDGARVSVVTDPGGAMFAVISARPQPGPYLTMSPGAVSWVELMTRRPDVATRFYGQVFGWTAETQDAGGTPYTTYRHGGLPVGGMIPTPPDVPDEMPDTWSAYFTVTDCTATVERAGQLGASVIVPPMETPAGPFAVLADPTGAAFQIMQYTAEIT